VSSHLSGIFGSSPVEPLQLHMGVCHRAASDLRALVAATQSQDWENAEACLRQISQREHEADVLKQQIRRTLTKPRMLMPVHREDLLKLILAQDAIANLAKKTGRLILWRKLVFPESVGERFLQLLERTTAASKKARKSIRRLDELFETSFRGPEAERVEEIIGELDEIETETDRLQRAVRDALLEIEKDHDPIDVMFMYQAIDLVGEIADMAERVGRRLENLLAI
jgi:predicted phosphate transport protein (TIGR00153 family)